MGDDLSRVEGRRRRGVGVGVSAEGAECDVEVAIVVDVGEKEDVVVVERGERREDDGCFQNLHFHCIRLDLVLAA